MKPKTGDTIFVTTTDRNRPDKPTIVKSIHKRTQLVTDEGVFDIATGNEVGVPDGKRAGWGTRITL